MTDNKGILSNRTVIICYTVFYYNMLDIMLNINIFYKKCKYIALQRNITPNIHF